MKKIIIRSFIAIAALAAATGCIEETFPQGSTQTQDQVAKNPAALRAMVNAIPASMTATNTAGHFSKYSDHGDFGIGSIHLRTDFMCQDLATMGSNPFYNRFYSYCMCQSMGGDYIAPAYFWECYYTWIKAANDVISMIDPATEDPELRDLLGQVYAYRASFYLDLARLYEPKENDYLDVTSVLGLTVPIVTELTTETAARNNPRVEREEMYDFILSDLDMAASLLDAAESSYTRPTIHAVNALYARAYLEKGAAGDEGAYGMAIDYAQKVIDESGRSPLTQTEWEDPVNGFNNGAANNSWIWGVTLSSENIGNIMTYTAHISSEAQWGYAQLSHIGADKSFYDQISNADFRKHSWLDPKREEFYNYKYAGSAADAQVFINGSPAMMIDPAMDYQSIKFRPYQGDCTNYTISSCADHPLIRVEEMYFIIAEALAQTDNLNEARAALNNFMKYRILDGSYDCTGKSANVTTFLNELLFQKRVEFWGEGIVMYDHKRLDIGITRGYPGTNQASQYCLNVTGRSPQWNIVVSRLEYQANLAITDETNNPDPSEFTDLWVE